MDSLDPAQTALRLAHELHSRGHVAAARLVAVDLVATYLDLSADDRSRFFRGLAEELGPDRTMVDAAIARYQAEGTDESLAALAEAAEAPRQSMFRALNTAPRGTATSVAMRADLLALGPPAELEPVARDLLHLLTSWFNPGFLNLRTIDWETPAHILEKLIEYEAVHEISGWDDLRRRLAPDRRCFGFFHPALGDEPVIFVEVALTTGMAASIQTLLDSSLAAAELGPEADTAVFYSITNCQAGLRGISFGDFLIKGVVERIRQNLPQITNFVTLSPIPGFGRWLRQTGPATLGEAFETVISLVEAGSNGAPIGESGAAAPSPDAVAMLERHRDGLLAAATEYLELRRSDGNPIDSVARFHHRNGAHTARVNWLADTSVKGLTESAGMLVNYVYA